MKQIDFFWKAFILSLIVIAQAIILSPVSSKYPSLNLQKKASSSTPNSKPLPPASIIFTPNPLLLKSQEQKKVSLSLFCQKPINLDGLDIVFNFNPEMVELVSIDIPQKQFSFKNSQINNNEGIGIITLLNEATQGASLNQNTILATLNFKGKSPGTSKLEIVSRNYGPKTILTETGTSKEISYDSLPLVISVENNKD